MRAPGKVSARPALTGSRVAIAESTPVREPATPPAKALAMSPGPRIPQRTDAFELISFSSMAWAPLGADLKLTLRAGRPASEDAFRYRRTGRICVSTQSFRPHPRTGPRRAG